LSPIILSGNILTDAVDDAELHGLLQRCLAAPETDSSQLSQRKRSWCRCAIEHAFDADIFINIRPMNTNTLSNDLPMITLRGSRFGQSP